MAETQTKVAKSQDAEKAQEKRKRAEPTLEHMKALAGESAPFAGLLGVSAMESPLESHAAFLGDARFSHPVNNVQKARIVTELQGTYGNAYVQRVLGRIQLKKDEAIYEEEQQIADIGQRIAEQKGSGQSLEPKERSEMEVAFSQDFGDIRVHSDASVDKLAEELGAKAFTTGEDIFFREGVYQPNSEAGKKLLSHELAHVVQQSHTTPVSPVRVVTPCDAAEIEAEALERAVTTGENVSALPRPQVVRNEMTNRAWIQKAEGEEGGEEPEETEQPEEVNVALYDQNPAHMHQDDRRDGELRYFRNSAIAWARDYGASSYSVSSHSDISARLAGVVAGLPAEGRIGTIACLGHGSSRTGWCNMGNIGDILVGAAIRNRLSPNLRVILYMCLAGASPSSALPTIEPGGDVPARESGGIRSFAAALRDRLVGVGLENVEVWAHTVAGAATTSPHWRAFTGEGEAGEAFFRTVFDVFQITTSYLYLRMCYRGLDEAARTTRSRTKRFPTSTADLCDRWMWKFYLNSVSGQEIATRIPMEPEECAEEIQDDWRAYYHGDSSVLIQSNIMYDFLHSNDFADLSPPF
jgi:hypothetical protein